MKNLIKYTIPLPSIFLLIPLFFCLSGCFTGCNTDNKTLEKAEEISAAYKDLEIKVNDLASRFDGDGNIGNQEKAEFLRDEINKRHTSELQHYIDNKSINEQILNDREADLVEFKNEYKDLAGTSVSDEPEDPKDERQLDSDGDGVLDEADDCPEQYGERKDGCPKRDTDNDGVYDEEDDCPNKKGTAANKGCPKKAVVAPRPKPKPKPKQAQDSDGDGVPDMFDDCPYEFGLEEHKGCKPPPPPPLDSDNDGFVDSVDDCPNDRGIGPDGCPIECNKESRFAPFKLAVECKKEVKTGLLEIKPVTDLVLEEFRIMANDNGQINYYIKDLSGKNLNNRTQSNINAGPNLSQIRTSDLFLQKGRTYQLIVETQSENLTLITDSCSNSNFSNSNAELIFTGEPFIHQLTFCKK